jgi:branched-chain amino acid transport system substrate-binding protein
VTIDANGDLDRESFMTEARNGKQVVKEILPAVSAK